MRIDYGQIAAIYAYKRDCFSVDQIRILIGSTDHQCCIEVTEEDEGYCDLIAALPKNLAGFPEPDDWWKNVALPPFSVNFTRLYERHV